MGKQMLGWPQSRQTTVIWASLVSMDTIEAAFPHSSDNVFFSSKAEIVCYMKLLENKTQFLDGEE